MKKLNQKIVNRITILIFLLLISTSFQSDGPPWVNISLDKMDVLYIGIENPISVFVPGVSMENMEVIPSGDLKLTRLSPGKYTANPLGNSRQGSLKIVLNEKLLATRNFRIRKIGSPVVLLGWKTSGTVSRTDLQKFNGVYAGLSEAFPFDGLRFDVTGYTFIYSSIKAPFKEIKVTGNSITDEIKDIFKSVTVRDRIFITNVLVQGPDCSRTLNGPSLEIVSE